MIVALWAAGASVFCLRTVFGVAWVQRMRLAPQPPLQARWQATLDALATRFRMRRCRAAPGGIARFAGRRRVLAPGGVARRCRSRCACRPSWSKRCSHTSSHTSAATTIS
jgi:hypothetical protein